MRNLADQAVPSEPSLIFPERSCVAQPAPQAKPSGDGTPVHALPVEEPWPPAPAPGMTVTPKPAP